ncbi:MAG: phenylpyruvate tautomerase MIF-related protein [Myxococcales bacterium]
MPLIKLDTTESLSDDAKKVLCTRLSRLCAETTGKPETYVMVVVTDGVAMLHAGKPGPAAFVDVRAIGGLNGTVNGALAEKVCKALLEIAKVPGDRVYLNFTSLEAANWGHDGSTFG